jgi:putative peptide zinc metalloprotease protein
LTDFRPKFRADLIVSDYQESSGKKSIVLKDPVSEKYYRLSRYEFTLLKALDGTVTVPEAVVRLRSQGRHYPADEAAHIVEKVANAGLLLGTPLGSAKALLTLKTNLKKVQNLRKLSSVYYLYLPLLNPDRFLDRTLRIFRLLVNRFTAIITGLLGLGAVYLIVAGIPRMETEYLFFFNWENLLYLTVVTSVIKVVHEFGHAYVAKSFGLHVPRMGIAFLLFFPCMYCDTTDAWKLADRKQRMIIGAAGILTELTVAILATYVWFFSRPGIVNSLAFYLLVVSTVSTLLFNGNPLMKFDGYFILMDFLRKPNLAARSTAYVKYLFMNRMLGIQEFPNPARSGEEHVLFALYGLSAFVYRLFLYFAIVAGIYYRFDKLVGFILALLAFGLFALRPLVKAIQGLWEKRADLKPRPKEALVFLGILCVMIPLLIWPWSSKSVFPCFMDSSKSQKLTVPLQTSLVDVFVREGVMVEKGTLLVQLEPYALQLDLIRKQVERDIIGTRLRAVTMDDKEKAKARGQELELSRAEAAVHKTRQELERASEGIRAPFEGVIAVLDPHVQKGFMPGKGSVIGEMKSPTHGIVHAFVPGTDIHKVKRGQPVEVWFPVNGGTVFKKTIREVRSYNERNLADSPFSSRLGGEIATEMESKHAMDAPLEDQFVCSVEFSDNRTIPLGMTGRLVIAAPPESALTRLFHHAVQTFNRESLL